MPKDVDRYFKEIKKQSPSYTDAQAWATAWSVFCKHKNPGSDHCHMNPEEYLKGQNKTASTRVASYVRVAYRFLKQGMSLEKAKEVLGFPPESNPSESEVERRRREKAIENHPDRGGDPKRMVEVNVAADILAGKQEPDWSPPGGGSAPGWGGYTPSPVPKKDPVVVTWDEAAASASIPSGVNWKFKTQTVWDKHGFDTNMSGFVVVGELGPEKWVFVAVEHYRSLNGFTGEDIDEWWMSSRNYSGPLRDVAPKAIREMFSFPHVSKQFNAKVELLPEGTTFTRNKIVQMSAKVVSFKDAMDLLGELKDDDVWKNRKLQVTMILGSNRPPYDKNVILDINGREHVLKPESAEMLERNKVLKLVYGPYYYWTGDKKLLSRHKSGKKILEYMSEKLVAEPQSLRDLCAAAAAQLK